MINFKKMLAVAGLLAVAVLTTLNVVACKHKNTSSENATDLGKVVK